MPFDIELPNGAVIEDVPDGTPKAAIRQKAIEAGWATAADFDNDEATRTQREAELYEKRPEQKAATDELNFGSGNPVDAELAKAEAKLEGELAKSDATDSPEQHGLMPERSGFIDSISDAFTGRDRMTPDVEGKTEIGGAPELNELSGRAFKSSLGLMTESDPEQVKAVLQKQFGDEISFRQDEKGNDIAILPSGEYPLNRPGLSPQDVVRGIFDAAAFLPSTRGASILGTAAKGAATQGVIEGTGVAVGGDFDPESIALAGGINAGGKAVENAAGTLHRLGKGSPGTELTKAADEAEIPLYTSDVNPPETFVGRHAQQMTEKIPMFGTGSMRESQQQARTAAVDRFIEKYGGGSYSEIVESLKTNSNRIKRGAGAVLESTGRKLDDAVGEGGMPLDNTRQAIEVAKRELSKPGVIQSQGATDDLQTLISAIDDAPQTFTSIKENRTAFRDILAGFDRADRSQLPTRAKMTLKRVEVGMKKDMDEFAKSNLDDAGYQKWQRANNLYAKEAEKLKGARLKGVLDKGDATPEAVETMLFSSKPSEVKALYDGLTPDGKANARAAIVSRIANDLSKRASGITPNDFVKEMRKRDLQVSTFFRGDDFKAVTGLVKALDATKRAQDAAVTTPTGQQLFGAFGVTGLALDPGSTITAAAGIGGLARFYETPAVRDALTRLASLEKGSTQFEAALRDLDQAVLTAAQTWRNQPSATKSPPEEPEKSTRQNSFASPRH